MRTEVRAYGRDNLYDLVDGLADATFVYGFQQVAVTRCQGPQVAVLELAIWQLATPGDAYGLFTANRAGELAAIGNEGDTDVGRRLAFWQSRYFVQAFAREAVPDADMWALARAIAKGLPEGGKRPALVDRLPPQGLAERKSIFFHEELSIQSQLWLGGENLLGLGPQTDGLLAILVFQYDGYEAGAGKTFWVKDRNGIEVPVISARYSIWNHHGRLCALRWIR